jgi:hypothetical protein
MRFSLALVPVLLTATATAAQPAHARRGAHESLAGPRVQMAHHDSEVAASRIDEASAARFPRVRATAFGTISPDIECLDPPQCTQTDPKEFELKFDGLYGSVQLGVTSRSSRSARSRTRGPRRRPGSCLSPARRRSGR